MMYLFCKICGIKPIENFGTYHRQLANSKKLCYFIYCKDCLKVKRRLRKKKPKSNLEKLRENISNSIRRKMKKDNRSTFKYLDYSILELRNHLESKFDSNMNWNNYRFLLAYRSYYSSFNF